ncbi:MAG: hypothetical protein AAB036_10545 [Elusimicrobiota bacterium]
MPIILRAGICLVLLTPLSRAESAPLTGHPKRLSQAIPLRFSPRCRADKQVGDISGRLARYFFEVAGKGLDELDIWDPELVAKIHRAVEGIPLTIDCDPDLGTRYFRKNFLFWGSHRINIRELGQALHRQRNEPGSSPKEPWSWNIAIDTSRQVNKNKLFHEFLHHASVPALAGHNGLAPDGETVNRRQLDRVYACSGLAFPTVDLPVAWDVGRSYAMTAKACRTCLEVARDECGQFPEGPAPDQKVKPPKKARPKAFNDDHPES